MIEKKITFKQKLLLLVIIDMITFMNIFVPLNLFAPNLGLFLPIPIGISIIVFAVCTYSIVYLIDDLFNEKNSKLKKNLQDEKDYSITEKKFEDDLWALHSPTTLSLYYCYHFSKETPTAESIVKLTVFAYNYFNIDNAPMNVNDRNCTWMRECFSKGFKNTKELKQIHEFPDYFDIIPYIKSTKYINYLYEDLLDSELTKKYKFY